MIFDLGLKNDILYAGCEIEEIAGRLNLKTPINEAINIIGKNMNNFISKIQPEERNRFNGRLGIFSSISHCCPYL